MEISFILLDSNDKAPMELLLLADPSEKLVKEYLQKGDCYTANLNSEVVGVLLTNKTAPHTVEIMNVAVKESYQNQGIGKKMIKYVINEIKKQPDIDCIEIGTGNPGVGQMLLYQKCGFRIVGVDLDFFRRTHPEERIYENGIECRDMILMKMDLKEEE